jgi:histidinol-phosphatase (PHP family)
MSLFNLHTHTRFSDGSDEPSAYLAEAIRQGFSILGFSDHSPVPFENGFAIRDGELGNYCHAISALKKEHSTSADFCVLLGLEVDFITGLTASFDDLRRNYSFDYLIGSVHLVRNGNPDALWFIDGPDRSVYETGLKEVFGGDPRKAVTAYYHQVCEMIAGQCPDIIGHLDKVKMYNRGTYFSESDPWYGKLVDETLELIGQKGCVVEVNTRGVYKKRSDTLFPGPAILEKIFNRGIPVTLSSDAHKPHELSLGFSEAAALLKSIGFCNQLTRNRTDWIEVPL